MTDPIRCGVCGGYCTNGAECAISQLLSKKWDWRSGAPEEMTDA